MSIYMDPCRPSAERLEELEPLTSQDCQLFLKEFLEHVLVEGTVVGNVPHTLHPAPYTLRPKP